MRCFFEVISSVEALLSFELYFISWSVEERKLFAMK